MSAIFCCISAIFEGSFWSSWTKDEDASTILRISGCCIMRCISAWNDGSAIISCAAFIISGSLRSRMASARRSGSLAAPTMASRPLAAFCSPVNWDRYFSYSMSASAFNFAWSRGSIWALGCLASPPRKAPAPCCCTRLRTSGLDVNASTCALNAGSFINSESSASASGSCIMSRIFRWTSGLLRISSRAAVASKPGWAPAPRAALARFL
mmetsp:Transcript_31150/g.103031  ORF Transcript_31150/g.103031 Transcript_31150/m.103031 type:complete len:210 (+) Transcript_31150:47-676(+)